MAAGAESMADKLKNVTTDDPDDFMDLAHAAVGQGDALGVTDFDLGGTKWQTKGGVVTSGV